MMLTNCTGACADAIRSLDCNAITACDSGSELLFQHTLSIMLRSAAPKLLLWSDQYLLFFNDAYSSIDVEADLGAMGESVLERRPELWSIIEEYVSKSWRGEDNISANLTLFCAQMEKEADYKNQHHCRLSFASVVDRGSNRHGVLIDICDNTEHRQVSERLLFENSRLKDLFSQAPVMMAYASRDDLKLEFVNNTFRSFFGGRPLEGLEISEAIPEADEQGFIELLRSVLITGEPIIGTEIKIAVRTGATMQTKYADYVCQPVRDGSTHVVGLVFTGTDVTEKVKARFDRDALLHHVLHASRINAMGTLAMTVAHELNQPLAAATNYLNASRRFLTEQDGWIEDAKTGVESAQEQIRRAGDIIKRMRPLIRSGEAERHPVSLTAAVHEAVALLSAGGGFLLKVRTEIPPDADKVLADRVQLEQVLVNLLRNADEASRESARKEAVVSAETLHPNHVLISVRDFGRGLSANQIAGMTPASGAPMGRGLGVGLSLSRTLVEANAGNLHGSNAWDGDGAVFSFDLEAYKRGAAQI